MASEPLALDEHKSSALPPITSLRQAVLLTLAYFDAQGLAVTAYDVWFNLLGFRASYRDVLEELSSPKVKERLVEREGYFSLRSSEHIEARQIKHKLSEHKWRRARRVAVLLSLVPFVETAAVCDSVALNKAKPGSDIDFFIVTRPGRMWTARMLATGLTNVLRLRRHGSAVKDRACLSFYATSDALAVQPLSIAGGDPYLAQWVNTVTPLWQRRGFDFSRRIKQANEWTGTFFPQRVEAAGKSISNRRAVGEVVGWFSRPVQALAELFLRGRLGTYLEQRLRRVQLRYMRKSAPYEVKNRSCHIVINDHMLKFHEQDRRTWFRERTVATYERLMQEQDLQEAVEDVRFAAGLVVQPVGATVRLGNVAVAAP